MDEQEFELEGERGGRGGARPRGYFGARRPARPRRTLPWIFSPAWAAPYPVWSPPEEEPARADVPPEAPLPESDADDEGEFEAGASGDPYVRWVQAALNRILGFRLVVDGINGPATRSAVRSFQLQQGLTVDGVVGPRTEAELVRAGGGSPPSRAAATCPHPDVHSVLPSSGAGFYSYDTAARQFAMPDTIRALLATAARWNAAHPQGPRIGVGDISLRCGGRFEPHVSHQHGLDVDLRPVRSDGQEAGVRWTDRTYSRWLTQELVDAIRRNGVLPVSSILFNDPAVQGVTRWSGHDDHLHVRFAAPTAHAAELASEGEFEAGGAAKSFQRTLRWVGPFDPNGGDIQQVAGRPGVYIIERRGRPLYVGQSHDLAVRVPESLKNVQRNHGGEGYKVRVATFRGAESEADRRRIEHALIRALNVMGYRPSASRHPRTPLVITGPMNLVNLVPYPAGRPALRASANGTTSLSFRPSAHGDRFEAEGELP